MKFNRHHVVINNRNGDIELWIDGELFEITYNVPFVYNDKPLLIGYSLSGDFYQRKYWSGKIDDIRIYNRALSEDEIKMLFSLVQNPDNGHWYQLVVVHPGINWYDARDSAAAMEYGGMQGHLATLTSFNEEQFVLNNFPQIIPEYVWLGATDERDEDNWEWVTGEEWGYTNWDPGASEPNGGTFENCLDYSDGLDKWNDESCDRMLKYYLVEYSMLTVEVPIDIKPGSYPNSINLKSKGKVPVAILTTDDFDATTVDPLSVEFGPDGAIENHGRGHIEDVDGDGDLDLVLHFRTQDTGIQCGDTSASLTGETFSGQAIEGSDSIKTTGC
ncbi:MAG: lectin-like protein [Nitrospinales bacterium]